MPIERAVPKTILAPCFTSLVLRSSSFSAAISSACCWVSVPACSRPGFCEPLFRLSFFLIISATGDFLTMKEKVLSS